MKYRYRWSHYYGKSRKQENLTDEKGPSYKIPFFGSKFKQEFVVTRDADGYPSDTDFVLRSKSFESEVFSVLVADPDNPYVLEANGGYDIGRMRKFDLKNGTVSHLYYLLEDPTYADPNSKETRIAIDIETGHIVELKSDNSVVETGLDAIYGNGLDLAYNDYLVCKNQNNKYLIYDRKSDKSIKRSRFKIFTDKEFDTPCEVKSKESKDGNSYVLIKDGDKQYVFDKSGQQVGEFALDETITKLL